MLMMSIVFGIALLVKDTYVASPAGTLFHGTVSIVCALFTWRLYKREASKS
jgi:hypothetical protein